MYHEFGSRDDKAVYFVFLKQILCNALLLIYHIGINIDQRMTSQHVTSEHKILELGRFISEHF